MPVGPKKTNYRQRRTSAAAREMFRGLSGYMQADVHISYDALFRGYGRISAEEERAGGPGASCLVSLTNETGCAAGEFLRRRALHS